MTSSELILPFGLPPPELAKDLLRQMELPSLATLLGQAHIQIHANDPYARVLPHQAWLLGRMNEASRIGDVAATAMAALGLPKQEGKWTLLHPAHFHIARDHLVLTDLRQLPLAEDQSRALFEAAAPLFGEAGMELVWGNARLWFLRADRLAALETSTPDVAVGHNVDIWMPRGEGERDWRRIHNEVQMSWHAHPVNEAREMAGLKPVNALWCWNATGAAPAAEAQSEVLDAFLPCALKDSVAANDQAAADFDVINDLAPSALAGDWGRWLQTMHAAEKQSFAPALQALKSGQVSRVRLLIGDDSRLLQADCSRLALKKFWRGPTLASLAIPREASA